MILDTHSPISDFETWFCWFSKNVCCTSNAEVQQRVKYINYATGLNTKTKETYTLNSVEINIFPPLNDKISFLSGSETSKPKSLT